MSWAKKTDDNQKEIVKTFRKLGANVAVTSSAGDGFPDLTVQYRYPGRRCHNLETLLVEVKDSAKSPSRRALTPLQKSFHSIFVCHIVESVKDVYDLLEVNYQD